MRQQGIDCAAYFQKDPAWRRIFEQLLRKYQSFGHAAGTVKLPDATKEECAAAARFFGQTFSAPLQFRTADFEAALQTTVYRGVYLQELLEAYFGREIRTKRQTQQDQEGRLAQLLSQAGAECGSPACRAWLAALGEKTGNGYQRLVRASADPHSAHEALSGVCSAADCLEARGPQPLRLAVLSALAVSDPHRLDAGTLCGELFLHYLAFRAGRPTPSGAEERDALFYRSGILNDSISSSVHQVGLLLYTEEGEHPAYRAFRERGESCTLTLTNLARLTAAKSPSQRAYLVENQMVFSQLCDYAEQFHSPLICTSGQPQIAVLRLLDLLEASGTLLLYSGDFDGKGLSIATQLLKRCPRHLRLWHMGPEDYEKSRSEKDLTQRSAQLLHHCDQRLEPTAQAILKSSKAGYQELLLPELRRDLTEM